MDASQSFLSLPVTFWTRSEVLHALENRDAGALLRLVRQYGGASQHSIGAAVELAQPHVSRIMSGKQRVTALHTWQRLADGLRMPDANRRIIGLADTPSISSAEYPRSWAPRTASVDLWSAPKTVEDIAEITLKDLMRRREVLSAGGALLAGVALTEMLEPWLVPTRRTADRGRRGLGEAELQRIEAAAAALRHWNDRWHLGIGRKAVVGQLSEVCELADTTPSAPAQARLFVVMAELSRIIASMSYDAGDHPTAQNYYILSLRANHQAGPDHKLYGVRVLADMARQMLDTNNPHDALDISRLALDTAQSHNAPPSVLALLRTREGWSYAAIGRAAAFTRCAAQAEELVDSERSDQLPQWVRSFDHAELSGVLGARYRDLARRQDDEVTRHTHAQMSATYIHRALRLRDPAKRRNRAFDLIGLGRSYLVLGEPEESARVIHEVLDLERNVGSGRVRRRLRAWYREATAFSRVAAVAEARTELSDALHPAKADLKESS